MVNSAKDDLELVYVDVWWLTHVASIESHHYYVNFVDGFSKFNWLFPFFHKFDALAFFKNFKLLVEKQTGKEIKDIQTNNGGEFIAFTKFLEQSRIGAPAPTRTIKWVWWSIITST